MITTITLNPSIDRTVTVRKPNWGGTNKITSTRLHAGGHGIYVSQVLDVLDVDNVVIGLAGRENYRDFASLLLKSGVYNDFVMLEGLTRTNLRINDKSSGAVTELNESGMTLNEGDMARLEVLIKEHLQYNDVAVITGNPGGRTRSKLMETLVKDCKAQGAYVIVDLDGAFLQSACNGIPYMITPNVDELSTLTKERFRSREDIIKAAREITAVGIEVVVVKMGAEGMLYITRRDALYAPARNIRPVCTIGAGDAAVAALAFTKQWGMGGEAAIQLATSAGAAALLTEIGDPPMEQVVRDNAGIVEVQRIKV
jgi:1-phosphofructokinase